MSKVLNGILVILIIAGIALMLYPSISDYSNKKHQTRAVAVYEESVKEIDTEAIEEALMAAEDYNQRLYDAPGKTAFAEENQAEYESLLNISETGIMGYVDIPQIHTTLPIYHGTDESVLQVAVGHLEWTSLPVGGEGTHSVLSGHRGLPSAKLFTDLDLMNIGDIFTVHIYNKTLYYQVDQITVVLPEEAEGLLPKAGKDYCTLITCTPYGVNTHRLLVRGTRIYPEEELPEIESDVEEYSFVWTAGILSAFWVILISGITRKRRKRKVKRKKYAEATHS